MNGGAGHRAPSHAQSNLLRYGSLLQLLKPCQCGRLLLPRFWMSIENSASSNCARWVGMPKNESIPWSEHEGFGKLEPHEAKCTRLSSPVAIKSNGCHGLGGEGMKVNLRTMLQRRRTLKKPCLDIHGFDREEGVRRD